MLGCNRGTDEDREDGTGHCMGASVNTTRELLYWTQQDASKAHQGHILRANIDILRANNDILPPT
ncbi:hypothetical protein FIBSPDRAFT_1048922 [Athelia psychrophila]|uniref:Uncharacterized protein n=1 Tax=Athelia psychrophila TaxID=1759441 RepID=A0A166CYZ2_9AGAM|nr:hypothetical protein FIBSPDRAFT_1048922 [Fibularhizoctonia sp. CBS 109695]